MRCPSTGKLCYPSKRTARRHARQTQTLGTGFKVGRFNVWRCDGCGWFHIGHGAGTWRPREAGALRHWVVALLVFVAVWAAGWADISAERVQRPTVTTAPHSTPVLVDP